MLLRNLLLPFAALALAGTTVAQAHSVVFVISDSSAVVFDGASGLEEARDVIPDEVMIVTPLPITSYSARTFLSKDAQYAYTGDIDLDSTGIQVDSSSYGPASDIDAVLVKRYLGSGAYGPRDLYYCSEDDATSSSTAMPAGFVDSDVFRYDAQGSIEYFITEAQLETATGGTSLDLDAICQSSTGELFFSFSLDEVMTNGTLEEAGIGYIPAAAITYDASGNVVSILADSAVVVATEADVKAMMTNSGFLTSVGGAYASSPDIGALDIDPAGGTWTSPVDNVTVLPNLLFAWTGYSNDGGILSTAGGGSIASINATPMASTVATTGAQIGLLPASTGVYGLAGLAIIPYGTVQPVLEIYPTPVITSSSILWTQPQVSNCTPGAPILFYITVGPSGTTGNFHPALTIPGVGGQLFGYPASVIVLGTSTADGNGMASFMLTMPSFLVSDPGSIDMIWQAIDPVKVSLSTPGAMRFL